MKKATREDLMNLSAGTPVVVDINEGVCDIAIFLQFNPKTEKILVMDCLLKNKDGRYIENVCEYDECRLVPSDRESILRLINKAN
jgi:hypothetical protein